MKSAWRQQPWARPRLVLVGTVLVAVITVVLAVPGLRTAAHEAASVRPMWLIGALALEVASCLSFVVIFRSFFDELPASAARRLAWIEMGSGALLPGGGAGSLVAGGVLLHRAGMPTPRIVEKSSGLFFLTSAVNVLALGGAGLGLAIHIGHGPRGLWLALPPALAAFVALAAALVVPRTPWHRKGEGGMVRSVVNGITLAERELTRLNWRLLGAAGYLGFDIAVLGCACAGVGHPIGIPALVLAYLIGYAANALPVPGSIGVLDGGLVGALTLYGAKPTAATAAVLIYHTIAFWTPSLGGVVAYALFASAPSAPAARPSATAGPVPCEAVT